MMAECATALSEHGSLLEAALTVNLIAFVLNNLASHFRVQDTTLTDKIRELEGNKHVQFEVGSLSRIRSVQRCAKKTWTWFWWISVCSGALGAAFIYAIILFAVPIGGCWEHWSLWVYVAALACPSAMFLLLLSKYLGNWIGGYQANALEKAGIKNAKIAESASSGLREQVEELRRELERPVRLPPGPVAAPPDLRPLSPPSRRGSR